MDSAKFIWCLALCTMLLGCTSGLYKVSTSEDTKPIDEQMRYSVSDDINVTSDALPDQIIYDETRMPVEVVLGDLRRYPDESGVSDVLWLLSFGLFPMMHSEYMQQDVTVKTPLGERSGWYRVDAKWWAGWIPLIVGYPSVATKRCADPSLPNDEYEREGRENVVASLAMQFEYSKYVDFAKKRNCARAAEIAFIATATNKVEELLRAGKFEEAGRVVADSATEREGSKKCDQRTWENVLSRIDDAKEVSRVEKLKVKVSALIESKSFDEAIRICETEQTKRDKRYEGYWSSAIQSANDGKTKWDREIELARIENKKQVIDKLFHEHKFDEVIKLCSEEKGFNPGSRYEDDKYWKEMQKKAHLAMKAADRSVEKARVEAKVAEIARLVEQRKWDDVVALCRNETGDRPGSCGEDVAKFNSYRVRAIAEKLLQEHKDDLASLKGFYLGMSLDEAEALLDYYFPKLSHRVVGNGIKIDDRPMLFCSGSSARVTRLNFDKAMLESLFDTNAQSNSEWAQYIGSLKGFDFRSGIIQDGQIKGEASISVTQKCFTYRNGRKGLCATLFCEKEVEDQNENPEDIEAGAMRKLMNSNVSDPFSAYGMGLEYGIRAGNVKAVRAWLKEDYVNGKGGEEGTLRLETCVSGAPAATEVGRKVRHNSRPNEGCDDTAYNDGRAFAVGVGEGVREANALESSSEFDTGVSAGESAAGSW